MAPVATARQYEEGMLRKVRVLIVGGGATGQVYGYYLSRAGCEVGYYLKHKYAAEAESGFTLHRYGLVGKRRARNFEGFEVYTRPSEVRTKTFDQVWLCVSSPAIRGELVPDLDEVCPEALWVSLQPGLEDRQHLLGLLPAERLVSGMVGFVAYQAPLPGEDLWPEGVAYWLPPLSPSIFTGEEPFVSAVANLLQQGGMNAGVRPDVSALSKYGSGVLMPFVLAAEIKRWSLTKLRKDSDLVGLLCASIEENYAAVKKETGVSPGASRLFTRLWVWKLALLTAPVLSPFPVEEYLKFHFTKVREQTEEMMASFIDLCARHSVEHDAIETLRDLWLGARPEVGEPTGLVEETDPASLQVPGPDAPAVAFKNADASCSGEVPILSVGDDEPTPVPGEFEEKQRSEEAEQAKQVATLESLESEEVASERAANGDADEPEPEEVAEPSDEPNQQVASRAEAPTKPVEGPPPAMADSDEMAPTEETAGLADRLSKEDSPSTADDAGPTDEEPSLAEKLRRLKAKRQQQKSDDG